MKKRLLNSINITNIPKINNEQQLTEEDPFEKEKSTLTVIPALETERERLLQNLLLREKQKRFYAVEALKKCKQQILQTKEKADIKLKELNKKHTEMEEEWQKTASSIMLQVTKDNYTQKDNTESVHFSLADKLRQEISAKEVSIQVLQWQLTAAQEKIGAHERELKKSIIRVREDAQIIRRTVSSIIPFIQTITEELFDEVQVAIESILKVIPPPPVGAKESAQLAQAAIAIREELFQLIKELSGSINKEQSGGKNQIKITAEVNKLINLSSPTSSITETWGIQHELSLNIITSTPAVINIAKSNIQAVQIRLNKALAERSAAINDQKEQIEELNIAKSRAIAAEDKIKAIEIKAEKAESRAIAAEAQIENAEYRVIQAQTQIENIESRAIELEVQKEQDAKKNNLVAEVEIISFAQGLKNLKSRSNEMELTKQDQTKIQDLLIELNCLATNNSLATWKAFADFLNLEKPKKPAGPRQCYCHRCGSGPYARKVSNCNRCAHSLMFPVSACLPLEETARAAYKQQTQKWLGRIHKPPEINSNLSYEFKTIPEKESLDTMIQHFLLPPEYVHFSNMRKPNIAVPANIRFPAKLASLCP